MTIFKRFVLDRWRADVWWAFGIGVMVLLNLAFFPGLKGDANLDETLADLPPALQAMFGVEEGVSLGSAAGYLQSQLFSSLVPILLLVLAIGVGSGASGGSEEDGTLEFLLSYPVTRSLVLMQRLFGVTAVVGLHTLILTVIILVFCPMFGALEDVDVPGLITICIGCGALALAHGVIAFTVGAWLGKRTPAIAVASAIAAAGYIGLGLFSSVDAPAVVRFLSPWYWLLRHNLMVAGADWVAVVPALGLTAICAAVAFPLFNSRDLRGH